MQKFQLRAPKGQPLCSDAEKARIVAEIRRRYERAEGSMEKLAREYGISSTSYVNWSKQFPPAPLLRPVTIVEAQPLPSVVEGVLVSPQGYRVEGLSVVDLAQLLRLLA